ncbi:Uncharacterised protein [uncultured archaeon]|nr:Uncharacterised protein [uncultured archaeon]
MFFIGNTNNFEKIGHELAEPYPHDYRRLDDAEEILKNLPEINEDTIIGFF